MGHFTKAPIYLDKSSLLTDDQIKAVNNTLKSQYNRMSSQGQQKQNERPKVESPYTALGTIVDELVCYRVNGLSYYSIKANILKSTANEEFTLFETKNPGRLVWSGYYDKTDLYTHGDVFFDNATMAVKLKLDSEMSNKNIFISVWIYPVEIKK